MRPAASILLLAALFGCDRSPDATPDASAPAVVAAPVPDVPTAPRPPAPWPGPLKLAMQLIDQGRFEAARDVALRYVQSSPQEGRGPLLVGLTYHKAGNHGPAAPHLERAATLMPDDPAARHFLADCLFMLGDLDGARRHHEAHARLDPKEPDAQYGLGLVDLEVSRLDDAARHFLAAIGLFDAMARDDPRRFRARQSGLARCHARLADVHFARDEYAAARDELVIATTVFPQNISAFYTLSLVERRLGNATAADAALARYETARDAIIEARGDTP